MAGSLTDDDDFAYLHELEETPYAIDEEELRESEQIRKDIDASQEAYEQKADRLRTRIDREITTLDVLIVQHDAAVASTRRALKGRIVNMAACITSIVLNFNMAMDLHIRVINTADVDLSLFLIQEVERRLRVVEVALQSDFETETRSGTMDVHGHDEVERAAVGTSPEEGTIQTTRNMDSIDFRIHKRFHRPKRDEDSGQRLPPIGYFTV